MEITPFGPDDAVELDAYVELANVISRHDAPWEHPVTPTTARGRFGYGWDLEPAAPYLVRDGGDVVAFASLSTSEYDNLHLAWFELAVRPDHRRKGYGSATLAFLEDAARARGRTSVGLGGWESEAATGFAARHGYQKRHQAINRRQFLADVDRALLEKRYDEARPHAADYVLERRAFPSPDEELEQIAVMASAINDAPTDELEIEDEVFTAERMRAYETAAAGRGERLYRVVARHVPTGELAGQTVVVVEIERPENGHQHDTSVVRSHRGHRLGLLLKAEMIRWLDEAEPQLTTIDTWNAESNDQMIGVNELLGYRVLGRELAFQRRL